MPDQLLTDQEARPPRSTRARIVALCAALLWLLACASSCARRGDAALAHAGGPPTSASVTSNNATNASTSAANADAMNAHDATVAPAAQSRGTVARDVPDKVDPSAKYLFYLHGRIIQDVGLPAVSPRFGKYEYDEILDALAARGFNVVSEPRAKGTDPVEYARKVVGQIERLIKAGVPARHVTVVGASYGGAIAAFVSTLLKNREVNFVLMASCGNSDLYNLLKVDLYGNVLSIYDYKDDTGAGTCQKFFKSASGLGRHDERVLKVGAGHGVLYRPLKEWVEPVTDWANR